MTRPVIVPGANELSQSALSDLYRRRLDTVEGVDRVRQASRFVFEHAKIRRRFVEVDPELAPHRVDWINAVNGATQAMVERAVAALPCDIETCDGLVVVTSTYIGFPALSRRVQARLGLPSRALTFDLTGLGCAGPIQGLTLADMLIETGRCERVAVVCADAMASFGAFRRYRHVPEMSEVVAHALASDGAAAVVVTRGPVAKGGLSYDGSEVVNDLWSDALDQNDLVVDADNEPFLSVGKDIRARVVEELGPRLADLDPAATLFHPGGAALVKALSEAHPAFEASLTNSATVLRDAGNLGSASILWVLDRALEARRLHRPELALVALGPGIVSTMLRWTGVEFRHA